MRYLILLLALFRRRKTIVLPSGSLPRPTHWPYNTWLGLIVLLIATPAFAATPEASHCDRTEAVIENLKNENLSVTDATKFANAKANLYAAACISPVEAATAICADVNATAAQKCAVSNDFAKRSLRQAAGLGGKRSAETTASATVNAAQNAAEADWD